MSLRPRLAYVALGSNLASSLGDPAQQIEAALDAVSRIDAVQLVTRSSLYRSPAMLLPGQAAQPDYCNAVCVLNTALSPDALLDVLQSLEASAGRVRAERWGARVLDLDLLHVERERCDTARLQLPHPGIAQRAFVLVPLLEVAPQLYIEGLGEVATLAAAVPRAGLTSWLAGRG